MNTEYDLKFEEMKKYIPFLENMITRLESTNTTSSNPRQAQLDKIRSLRDLLSNKKKRMKMENLLKCEQVLVNLYAKVEQRDTILTDQKTDTFSIDSLNTMKEKSDLEAVRNKFKTVVKQQNNVQDTLPEILPRCVVSDVHTSGTKEPALFQRRPNQQQNAGEDREEKQSPPGSASKRNYTRVLVSPESSSRRWSSLQTVTKPLFSRRSPRSSPKRYSPTYYKRERKKSRDSLKQTQKQEHDVNITLNVPEKSLNSLSTKDILSRIINCSDGDVDIDTLRELRKQILGELKNTGANKDDISDLILKSYHKKKSSKHQYKEVEEGELSDSESEAIESIYGSLVVKEPGQTKSSSNQDSQPRKIQICLVINSGDTSSSKINEQSKQDAGFLELEMFEKQRNLKHPTEHVDLRTDSVNNKPSETIGSDEKTTVTEANKSDLGCKESEERATTTATNATAPMPVVQDNKTFVSDPAVPSEEHSVNAESTQFKANFYKPLADPCNLKVTDIGDNNDKKPVETETAKNRTDIDNSLNKIEKSTEIPLLHDRTVESKPPETTLYEIDILQALKNEILSDIAVPGTEDSTPPLHQPKVTKVACAQEILPKKRISIEKYKEKSVISSKGNLDNVTFKENQIKKSSLKLTDKECERFFSVPKISFDEEDESLDENYAEDIDAKDIYDDLAPRSPDHDDSSNVDSVPPVIIPVDRIKTIPVNYKCDVDMRTLPLLSPNNTNPSAIYRQNIEPPSKNDISIDKKKIENSVNQNRNKPFLVDPRVRDLNVNVSNLSPNHERTPRHSMHTVSSNVTPNQMTPNARTYEMTPTHQSFEVDHAKRKHVYVPTTSYYEVRERESSVAKEGRSWEDTSNAPAKEMTRFNDKRDDLFNRSDCSSFGITDVTQPFARIDVPINSLSPFGRTDSPSTNPPYGRLECPPTPSHSFGRLECPPTPSHLFGRLECPLTPNHPFGRTDCPPTPSHPFGRNDCPSTPSHPFGRTDCPLTPSHPFGRTDSPLTPSHPFGRTDCPPTPSHPFGRSEGPPPLMLSLMDSPYAGIDCPPTPTPLFGRNECPPTPSHTFSPSDNVPSSGHLYSNERPQTPSHHFGRSDTMKNRFSRPEYNTQKQYNKDPRLNRKPASELKSQFEEKDRGFYKERDRYHGNSYSSQKIYSGSDKYQGYEKEQSVSRNSKFKYYGPDYRGRHEHGMKTSLSKNDEKERAQAARDRRYNSDGRNYEDLGSRSVGRTARQADTQPSNRAHSVGRNPTRDVINNKLSVTSTVGSSFTIDTSINATFQKIIDSAKEIQGFVNSFDARRQRAASVGRSLAKESSVGKTLNQSSGTKTKRHENQREAFRRASSVGREIECGTTDNRSFQEIKDDFKTYKFSDKKSIDYRKEIEYARRSRRDGYEKQMSEKRVQESKSSSYSPRRNYRDPRMRRQFDKKYSNCSPDGRHSRKSGIVYSNDNIVTGSILASGYGVKNYKIPKIKRNADETESITENKETADKNESVSADKNDRIKKRHVEVEEASITSQEGNKNSAASPVREELKEDSDRKSMSTSTKNVVESSTVIAKQKKHKKLIYDSESDNEIEPEHLKDDKPICEIKTKEYDSPVRQKLNCKHLDPTDLNSNLGIDELEIFNDSTASDPVIDNINALIADLDSDINTSKNDTSHNFTNEISVENMMKNISSPEREKHIANQCEDDAAKILEAIDNISNEHVEVALLDKAKDNVDSKISLNTPLKINEQNCDIDASKAADVQIDEGKENCLKLPIEVAPTQSDALHSDDNENIDTITSTSLVKCNNDDIDSTTEVVKDANLVEDHSSVREITDGCSTPDSTINTDDSKQNMSNDDIISGNIHEVTSTETIEPKPSSSIKETTPALDSIGSLLSILDKSKIKELLNMLDDKSSENEKIKKKLEKLSEIVSDDEETSTEERADMVESKSEDNPDSKNNRSQETNDPKQEKTSEFSDIQELESNVLKGQIKTKKRPTKKRYKNMKKVKGRAKNVSQILEKRVTRASAPEMKQKAKKPVRELMQLQEDIKGMFIRDEVLSATGIRMCRLAKLVDTNTNTSSTKDETAISLTEPSPLVVLEKIKNAKVKETELVKKKNILSKLKIKGLNDNTYETVTSDKSALSAVYKAGPKSKTKNKKPDPYAFESDSVSETNIEKNSDNGSCNSSDFESDSHASSKSFGSTELLSEVKKKTKRKRPGWQAGIIKPKTKKKKIEPKQPEINTFDMLLPDKMRVPDLTCFTDRNYCFRKNQLNYSCRLCSYDGGDIVLHYRNQHPHVEIPLSRMPLEVAKEAIEQCEEVNFKAISKTASDKYVCIFCYKEFVNCKSVLETFFWHIVSTHTGEFKQHCSECLPNVKDCPFKLHIPPPPEETTKQLVGYICNKCNFTQISLENLKTHVIVRHDDKQTAVYTINLSVMTKKALKSLLRRSDVDLTSQSSVRLSDQVILKQSDDSDDKIERNCEIEGVRTRRSLRRASLSVKSTIQSKITFEGDDNVSEISDLVSETDEINIKTESVDMENIDGMSLESNEQHTTPESSDLPSNSNDGINSNNEPVQQLENSEPRPCNDIFDYPHFKLNQTESGGKVYFCCINGNYHFKTTLLISMKKHVQSKHFENWDGYCSVCKVIVTPQGLHQFKDCLQHYLDKHMDNFPMFEEHVESVPSQLPDLNTESHKENLASNSPKINVRPLSELIIKTADVSQESTGFPIIQSVTSLCSAPVMSGLSPTYPDHTEEETTIEKTYKYEEHQAQVVSKKYYLVVQAMITPDNLIKVFKCSGRFCSYVTDSAQEALIHAATHQRIGGTDALNCSYCDFDTAGNAVDLVMHVFKKHGCCQYCCQRCFYRALSSQAVGAHISRVHGASPLPGSVLRSTAVSSIAPTKYKMLSREQAVNYYICGHSDNDVPCKFKTYTPDKFCEHLQQRHTASEHPCHSCSTKFSTAAELIHHMKDHGMMLYQCTWCVYGAENKSGLLDHISILHPDKIPQAYIRIITNKEEISAPRVLPLAYLNKYKVPTKDMTPSATKENPEREAKRSIEMEALIGPFVSDLLRNDNNDDTSADNFNETNCNNGDDTTASNVNETSNINETTEEAAIDNIDTEIMQTAEMSQDIVSPVGDKLVNIRKPQSNIQSAQAQLTPLSEVVQMPDNTTLSDAPSATVLVKDEFAKTKTSFTDIFVVDSEDENSTPAIQTIIELSDDETTVEKPVSKAGKQTTTIPECQITKKQTDTNPEKLADGSRAPGFDKITVSSGILHTCPKCKQVCRSMTGLKKHASICITDTSNIQCAHCAYIADSFEKLTSHYIAVHNANKSYECKSCGKLCPSEGFVKRHLRTFHKETNIIITANVRDGVPYYLCFGTKTQPEVPKEKIVPKRKLSGSKADAIPVKRKFNPEQIDQLPLNPILDQLVYCSQCEFSTKVRLNMVRHLQLHAELQPVPQKAPVNPVPHLESNEKHFDKMANLASSSAVNRTPDKPRPELTQSVTLLMPPEIASRYPKYVPERQRHTCGAKGCSYISVDEAMLRRHWDTLHSGTSDFHCVHCPPQQHLDTSRPLTAVRILSHLKMHDANLYACSSCSYYHYKKELVEKHLSEIHKDGRLMVVREQSNSTEASATVQPNNAPTMDLKPWQCGLCKFKTMLHPEVVTHCFKIHQSKMQFKCAYCPFRTSATENISKHQKNSHAGNPEEVFYYFYREGSIPDEPDGTPRWLKQQQKAGASAEPEVKVEARSSESPPRENSLQPVISPITFDLNLVKKEVGEVHITSQSKTIEDLCNIFGQFCEPNGIKFKCPLCSVVMKDTREAMESHLYEELNYRKWRCGLCSYKAFHREGLTEHMTSEHRRQYDIIELPTDENIERWVKGVLDHQAKMIDNHKNNLMKQKIVTDANTAHSTPAKPISTSNKPGYSTPSKTGLEKPGSSTAMEYNTIANSYSEEALVKAFGLFGENKGNMYCCPKCSFLTTDGAIIRDHLEIELNKIRWYCSNCPENYQTYHEAQFHCKGHDGPSRPVEAIRDPNMRAAWVTTAILKQKNGIQCSATSSSESTPEKNTPYSDSDNSLLVVRYEENIPTPDQVTVSRKRPATDSDEEKLIIDEKNSKQKSNLYCTHCGYKSNYKSNLKTHMLKHFDLKPYSCGYCTFTDRYKNVLLKHAREVHKDLPIYVKKTELPADVLKTLDLDIKVLCLVCQKAIPQLYMSKHLHDDIRPSFSKNKKVLKCVCSQLYADATAMDEHYKLMHPHEVVYYTTYKIADFHSYQCTHCSNNFVEFDDFRTHHKVVHNHLPFKIETNPLAPQVKPVGPIRRFAKKSTTKLPNSVAKKSTTKLPNNITDLKEEYSYYGTKPPSLDKFSNVTTLMSFCNRMVPFTMTQLSQHLNIEPVVLVTKNKNYSD